ncbi:MAG TPA: APC family permease [Gemmatimonadota bacterium]|nr:APC family permease [Gemmatimonadota bacterium]
MSGDGKQGGSDASDGSGSGGVGFLEAASIGVGGMVGGGIFAVLGLAVQLAGGGTPVAFAIAGAVALVTAYAYSRLSVTFPSQGGTVSFLNRAFGEGTLTGSMNVLLWLSYVVMLSLYAFAFGSYGATFFPEGSQGLWKHVLISAAIVVIAGLNLLSSKVVGEVEDWIVGIKLAILLFFVGVGIWGVQGGRLAPSSWQPPFQLAAGGMIIFLAYEGFELIANTAGDTKDPEKTLPRAFFTSVGFVVALYVAVAIVTVGNLPVDRIVEAKDYALAAAARPFLGQFGFTLIAVAAMLSTASAINATLYGSARLSYIMAKDGELPALLEKKIWNEPAEGLLITAAAALLVSNLLDLSAISTMGSAGFLLLFAGVNAANVRLADRTDSRAWVGVVGAAACLAALAALLWQTVRTDPSRLWVLVLLVGLSVAVEVAYRAATGRTIRVSLSPSGGAPGDGGS